MQKVAIAIVLAMLSIECHAQGGPSTGQCDQIRSAIAQYGLQAARKHAMQNYGLSEADLRTIEQGCGIGDRGRRQRRERR
jgi:ribosomal protein S9